MSNNQKYFINKWLPWLFLFPFFILIAFVCVWSYQVGQPISYTKNYHIVDTTIHPGDDIIISYDTQRHYNCWHYTLSYLSKPNDTGQYDVDSIVFFGPITQELTNITSVRHTSKLTPVGTYNFFSRVNYICNPLDYFFPRTVIYNYGKITVVPNDTLIPK